MPKLRKYTLVIFLAIFCLGFYPVNRVSAQVLTNTQNTWLNKYNRTISVKPEKSNPPYVFLGSGTSRKIKGLSAEYLEAIASKIGAKVFYEEEASLGDILKEAKELDFGSILLSLSPTEELEKNFNFTDSYLTMPAVVVVRKDFKEKSTVTSLSSFKNKKIAVGEGYPVLSYIKTNYEKVEIIPVSDDEVALQKLLLGEVDGAVMDLASLSYYTSKDVLSYVAIGGQTGFEYKHSFAVPKSKPELLLILDQGLKALSDAEKQVIIDKWIDIGTIDNANNLKDVPNENNLHLWLIFAGFIVLIIATVVTVVTLRKTQIRMLFSRTRKKEAVSEVEDELKELQRVHQSLKEEMEHVSALEEDIEKKIHNVE
jgi:ABC-type amino acid transport substrate-binding protein